MNLHVCGIVVQHNSMAAVHARAELRRCEATCTVDVGGGDRS